jgi:hypothetical protein
MTYWACARLELRREAVAQHFLKLNGYETYIPRVREQRLRRGKRIETISPLFPAYAFIVIEQQWHRARWSIGVAAWDAALMSQPFPSAPYLRRPLTFGIMGRTPETPPVAKRPSRGNSVISASFPSVAAIAKSHLSQRVQSGPTQFRPRSPRSLLRA